MKATVEATGEHVQFTLTAPGILSEDLDVRVEDETLHIRVQAGHGEKHAIDRSFLLPRNVDASGASAVHEDGVLTITLPKKVPARTISIGTLPANAGAAPSSTNQVPAASETLPVHGDVLPEQDGTCAEDLSVPGREAEESEWEEVGDQF